jgi:hypothetical protein
MLTEGFLKFISDQTSNILAQALEPIYHLASERDCNSKTY